MNLRSKLVLSILLYLFFNTVASGQDDLLGMLDSADTMSKKVFATFKTTRIVNGHSIETVKKDGLDFRVTHHFGDISGDAGGAHTFFGMDQSSDIRIAFEYGVTNRLTVGIGRSKINEMIDGYLKYNILHQTQDNKVPISSTLLINSAITPQKNVDNEYDNVAHRLSYTYQVVIARKLNQKLSLQVSPTFLHRNYVFVNDDENDLFSLGIGGRFKLTKRFAILADYFYTFSKYRKDNKDRYFAPLGLGIEIETGGHVFHMFFTNNAGIIENSFIANTNSSWRKGEFKFGFNISRTFGLGGNK